MAFQGIGRLLYNYDIHDNAIRVLILGSIPVASFPLGEIVEMKEVSLKETLKPDFKTLRLGNRIIGRILEIRRSNGLFRRVLITPDEPDKFLDAWKAASTEK